MSLGIKILISAFLGFLAISLLVIFFGAMRPASAAPTSKAKTYRPVVAKTVKKPSMPVRSMRTLYAKREVRSKTPVVALPRQAGFELECEPYGTGKYICRYD